jgi:hypothetical protein
MSETRKGVKCFMHAIFTKFYDKENHLAEEIEQVESISDIKHLAESVKIEEAPTTTISTEEYF